MAFGIFLILVPLIIYALCAFTIPKGSIQNPDDYFIAYKRISTNPFSNSSIVYAFQVASVYPFLLWGNSKQVLVPFINAVFWGVGIFLFSLCIPKIQSFMGSNLTIHGFLGQKYAPSFRRWTSILTIIGLLGVAIAEIVWGSLVLTPIFPDENQKYLIMFLITFFVLIYISYGGQISSIRTDQAQLIFSYLGVFGILLYLLYAVLKTNTPQSAFSSLAIGYLLLYIPLLFIIRRGKFLTNTDTATGFGKYVTLLSNLITNALLIILIFFAILIAPTLNFNFEFDGISQLQGFGYSGLAALILLPLFFQFVDMTNWQRILALQPITGQPNVVKEVRQGLIIYAIESPFTWIIFIVLGVMLVTSSPQLSMGDIFINLPTQYIRSSSLLENFLGYGFIVSILAIMLSTVDSVIVAAMFTFVYDTNKSTRIILDNKNYNDMETQLPKILAKGRLFGLCALIIGLGFFIGIEKLGKGGAVFIGMLFAFYTAQLSFMPAVLGAILLKGRRLPRGVYVGWSIGVGAVGGILLGVYATLLDASLQWYPVIYTVLTSSAIYIWGCLKK